MRNLNLDRDKWNLAALSIPEDRESCSFITSIAKDPAILYSSTKSDVFERIKTLVDEDSSASFELKAESKSYLNKAEKAFKDWKSDRRSTRGRKISAGLQDVLCTIGDFVQSFSGIAEMVKGADQQYGGLAYGTVSLLLCVAAHKQRREAVIEEVLEELTNAFPRLQTLERIQPKESLRGLIVDVFELVILFCRETIEYFAQRIRRLKDALSPKELKMKNLSRLRTKLSEIHKECTIMVLEELAETRKQLYEMQTRLRQIETTGNDTNTRLRESQAWIRKTSLRDNETYLSGLKQLLGIKRSEEAAPSSIVARYKSILSNEFSDQRREQRHPAQMSWTLLTSDTAFSNWLERAGSAILLLGGSNWLDYASIQLNWMSFASVLVVESVASSSNVLSFFCQTDYTITRRKRQSFSHVVCSLVYQLVEQHLERLWPLREDIADALKSPKWQDADCATAYETMAQLLIQLFAALEKSTKITIVIDRLDQCRWSDDPENGASALDKAVGSLLDIVRARSLAHLSVKILLVMDEGPAQEIAKVMRWAKGRGLDWKVDWNQETDEESDE